MQKPRYVDMITKVKSFEEMMSIMKEMGERSDE